MRDHVFKIARFIISGTTAAVVNISSFWIFTRQLDVHYLIATAIGFLTGFTVSYLLQKNFSFKHQKKTTKREVGLFFLMSGTNFFVNLGLVFLLHEYFGLMDILSVIMSSGGIAVYTYLFLNFFLFKKEHFIDT